MAFVVFAGQSNMGGPYMDSSNVPAAWTPSPQIQIWNDTTHAWEEMQPGVNTGFGGDYAGTWGPEVEFALDFHAAHPGETLYIVKEADGGTALAVHTGQWNYDWSPNSPDELFDRTTQKVADASAALGGAHPDAVFWGQGEEDGTSQADAAAYGDNLQAFFAAVRADWMHDSNGKIGFFKIAATTSFADQVRAGEQRVDDADPNAVSFDTVGFPIQSDNLHYTAQGYEQIGDGFFQAYQSWRGDAGTGGGSTVGQTLTADPGGGTVQGGDGADSIFGGAGSDYLRGNAGDDRMSGGASFDDMNGNTGNDTLAGGDGDDWVVGGKDQDLLTGENGDDIVYGNLGDDTGDGGAGNDLIRGGQGDDVLYGQAGNDWISGDRGSDTITGGAGADTFHTFNVAGLDRVLDFSAAEGDRVQVDAGSAYTLSQVGADTVIDFGGGNEMVLANVQLASLPADWIFTL